MGADPAADVAGIRTELLASENERRVLTDADAAADIDLCLGPVAGGPRGHDKLVVAARCEGAGARGPPVCSVRPVRLLVRLTVRRKSSRQSGGERSGTEGHHDQQSDPAHASPLGVASISVEWGGSNSRRVVSTEGRRLSANAFGEQGA